MDNINGKTKPFPLRHLEKRIKQQISSIYFALIQRSGNARFTIELNVLDRKYYVLHLQNT